MDENTVQNTATAQEAAQNATGTAATEASKQVQGNTENTGNAQNDSRLEELIQKAVDRATNKLGNENKKLRGQIDELKKANLSAEELKQLEFKEKEAEIAEREKALHDRENRLLAIKAIKEAGLDDGSNASLDLIDFVMGEDEEAIKGRVKVFEALVKRFVQAQVDTIFKSNGRTPGVGNTAATESNNKNSVAVQLGKDAAKVNDAARATLDHYLGGKK